MAQLSNWIPCVVLTLIVTPCVCSTWSRYRTWNSNGKRSVESENLGSQESVESMLDLIDDVGHTQGQRFCSSPERLQLVPTNVVLRTRRFEAIRRKADLLVTFLSIIGSRDAKLVSDLLKSILLTDQEVYGAKVFHSGPHHRVTAAYRGRPITNGLNGASEVNNSQNVKIVRDQPAHIPPNFPWVESENSGWIGTPPDFSRNMEAPPDHLPSEEFAPSPLSRTPIGSASTPGKWTFPYYSCEHRKWLLTYSVLVDDEGHSNGHRNIKHNGSSRSVFDLDIDISHLDINQCDMANLDKAGGDGDVIPDSQIVAFSGSHKCHRATSQCVFSPGGGWTRGSYKCHCSDGSYPTTASRVFNGTLVEVAWREKHLLNSSAGYDWLYICRKCAPGCDVCEDDSPCLSEYNWAFRISLLVISVICIMLTLLLMGYVYNYRKLKVIRVASPIFLCTTLLGCVMMYSEMAAIFPVLDTYSCVATKWTRHLGFCVTYSALLLKTWRVSLTYRVKSAHKIKLTDKQLLHWLFPILLVMVIYLSTWTVSSPPQAIYIKDSYDLKFKQCTYDWWDHSLGIGEVLFLLWGIRVCYSVRNAESLFNEARHISYAIYNISIVNIIMVAIHLLIFPWAPPDLKYLFGFIRTQLSTTVTVIVVFGPKFYRVIRGQGDVYDSRARARGVTASFSLNGIGLVHEEATDLFQQNEELKEEIQKLAAQIEFMKIVQMEMNNRHIKPKVGGYFTPNTATAPVVGRALYLKFESADTPTSRISPAAELCSERV